MVVAAVRRRSRRDPRRAPLIFDSCYNAIIDWEARRHGWRIEREWIQFAPGAVFAVHIAVQAFATLGRLALSSCLANNESVWLTIRSSC